jgi:hypothetical protein
VRQDWLVVTGETEPEDDDESEEPEDDDPLEDAAVEAVVPAVDPVVPAVEPVVPAVELVSAAEVWVVVVAGAGAAAVAVVALAPSAGSRPCAIRTYTVPKSVTNRITAAQHTHSRMRRARRRMACTRRRPSARASSCAGVNERTAGGATVVDMAITVTDDPRLRVGAA